MLEAFSLTVVVPTRDEAVNLGVLLQSSECAHGSCGDLLDLRYVVVEMSKAQHRPYDIPEPRIRYIWHSSTGLNPSQQHQRAVEVGLGHVDTNWVLLVHSDCAVLPGFYEAMAEASMTHDLVGSCTDPVRIHAVRQSCLLTRTHIAKAAYIGQRWEGDTCTLDVCDGITEYCRKHELPIKVFRNTTNDPSLDKMVPKAFRGIPVDRCLDDHGNVIFMHLGRGVLKTTGKYAKRGKWGVAEWKNYCRKAGIA